MEISIHAPAWGATSTIAQAVGNRIISIHAPAWGATLSAWWCTARLYFNPRPRVGGDGFLQDSLALQIISIHAPAWGATSRTRRASATAYFNPRPRVGGDRDLQGCGAVRDYFNPRPRVGGDVRLSACPARSSDFNPRPRVGGDHASIENFFVILISIHAPAWGATRASRRTALPDCHFNPRPRVGGDEYGVVKHAGRNISIHAPAWGATMNMSSEDFWAEFQSTPPRGGRQPKHREISASGNPDISYDTSDSPRFTMISSCFSREPPRNF